MEIVKIKLRRNAQQGFLVTLTSTNRKSETEGFLPLPPPPLTSSFKQWQSAYHQLEAVRSYITPAPGERFRLTPRGVTVASNAEYTAAIKTQLNQWLNSGYSDWQPIRDKLIAIANQLHQAGKEVQVILDVKDMDLRRLPWQEWDLLAKYYPKTEVALSAPKGLFDTQFAPFCSSPTVRILVVVGRSDGINTKSDLQVIQKLEAEGAEVVCLMQPSLQELCEALWDERGYHIFVFTGHSGSREDGQIGWVEVNETESLSIEQFKIALREAISRGLQLAIFNSCDGLGLANQLAELLLPHSIVMREPVPDEVAVDFLKKFFKEFTCGKSLFAAVQTARKRLEPFNSKYPGAVWLPTICIRPSAPPVTWQGLFKSVSKSSTSSTNGVIQHTLKTTKTPIRQRHKTTKTIVLASLIGVVIGGLISLPIGHIVNPTSAEQSQRTTVEDVTVPAGTWRYGGSTTWATIRDQVDTKIEANKPQFNLVYAQHSVLPPGSGTGIKMLLDGQLSFAQSSRPVLDREYEVAASRGVKLKQVPIAIDGIAIVVHPDLKIEGLTIDQLKGIYTGQITNWSQVGGPDIKIAPYSRPDESGTTEFFKENILGVRDFGTNVVLVSTTTQALRGVGEGLEAGGIYYASAPEVINQCSVKTLPISRHIGSAFIAPSLSPESNSNDKCEWKDNRLNIDEIRDGEYPITRRLFVVVKQNGQVDEQAGEAYAQLLLTDEGQQLIQEAGFIPIRSF